MMTEIYYRVAAGAAPLPGIGTGPIPAEEYLTLEASYMAQFEDGAPTPRETGIYLEVELELPASLPYRVSRAARAAAAAEEQQEQTRIHRELRSLTLDQLREAAALARITGVETMKRNQLMLAISTAAADDRAVADSPADPVE